jgi:hypothetical protein
MVRKTLDNVWRSVELPKFNLYQLQLFEFPLAYGRAASIICTSYSYPSACEVTCQRWWMRDRIKKSPAGAGLQ